MSAKQGYDHRVRPNGEVHIFANGKMVKLVRGDDAKALVAALESGDAQELLAAAAGGSSGSRPGVGASSSGAHLHGNGEAHAPQQFRRKSG